MCRSDRQVHLLSLLNSFCSPSHFSSWLPFSTEYNDRPGGVERDQWDWGDVSFVPSLGGRVGRSCFVIFCSLCSSSLFLAVLIFRLSFFVRINNRRAVRGRTGPTWLAIKTRDETGGGRVRVMLFLLSTLFVSSPHSSSFLIVYSTITGGTAQQRGAGEGGRQVTMGR